MGPMDSRQSSPDELARERQERSDLRLAISRAEAARALGVSVDFFEEHVQPDLRIVRRGRRRLVPLAELDRWIDANASLAGGR